MLLISVLINFFPLILHFWIKQSNKSSFNGYQLSASGLKLRHWATVSSDSCPDMTDKTSEVIMTASTGRVWRRNQCVRQQHQRGEANHSARLCFLPPASLSRQHFCSNHQSLAPCRELEDVTRADWRGHWCFFVCIQTCAVRLWWPANSDAC